MSIPTRFWLTKGVGESDLSQLDAIDKAFMNSGIGYQNHVVVSSIPPLIEISPKINTKEGTSLVPIDNEWKLLPISAILHVVKSIKLGVSGDSLASCIALAKICLEINNKEFQSILAYEASGVTIEAAENMAMDGVKAMVEERNGRLVDDWDHSGMKIICSSLVVKRNFGCSVAFVVFDPFTYKKTE
jgi:pyruvoyl-dependent arginine decarboxylase (PvlArgDC)